MSSKRRCFARPNVVTRGAAATSRNAFPFFKLPAELRNRIYEYAIGWEHALQCVNGMRYRAPKASRSRAYRWTPGILLANRQIYNEAVVVAYDKNFLLEEPWGFDILQICFSQFVIQRLRHVGFTIDVDHDVRGAENRNQRMGVWHKVTLELANIRHDKHDLQELKITVKDKKMPSAVRDRVSARGDPNPDLYVVHIMHPFRALSRVKRVMIEGDLPAWYIKALKGQMEGEPGLLEKDMIAIVRHKLAY